MTSDANIAAVPSGAELLRQHHVPGRPLMVPNVWDAASARQVVDAGFPVVATSSVAVAATLGYGDGQQAAPAEMFAVAARIAAAVDAPLTVDAESGYGLSPEQLVDELLAADAVGCNVEDTDQDDGRRRTVIEQEQLLADMRQHAGERLVLNARIDSFLGAADERSVLDDAVERGRSYAAAGADCVYPIGVRSPDVLAEFVTAVEAPVNASYVPGGPDPAALAELGVARVSLGGGLWMAQQRWLTDTLAAVAAGTMPY